VCAEVADDVQPVRVEVLCWCGLPGLLDARVVDGAVVRSPLVTGGEVVRGPDGPPLS
jgi:thymidine kinase